MYCAYLILILGVLFTWDYFLGRDHVCLFVCRNSWCLLYPGVHCQCSLSFIITRWDPYHTESPGDFSLLHLCMVQALGFRFSWTPPPTRQALFLSSISVPQTSLPIACGLTGSSFLLHHCLMVQLFQTPGFTLGFEFHSPHFMCRRPCFRCLREHGSLNL